MGPLQGNPSPWSAPAIRDTVAAIARQPAYGRVEESTWLMRGLKALFNWASDLVDTFFTFMQDSVSARWVGAALVALLLGLIVLRAVLSAREAQDEAARSTRRMGRRDDAWRDAERLASEGRYTEAAHALLATALTALAARQEVRLHPSKTVGDYARELRMRRSPSSSDFAEFRRRYEGTVYGDAAVTADGYARLVQLLSPLRAPERAA